MSFLEILSQNSKIALKVKVNFQYLPRELQDAHLVQIYTFWLKSIASYCVDKPNFLEFKMVKMNLKVKVNDPHFQYKLRVSARQGSMCLCPIKISLGPHFMSLRGPKTLLYLKSQCHYNMKGLRFG